MSGDAKIKVGYCIVHLRVGESLSRVVAVDVERHGKFDIYLGGKIDSFVITWPCVLKFQVQSWIDCS